ncbi:Cation transport ATPase [sediment metagenome]|uniref:Cation transport ATPase n=1 Tax=sediment metagenome TaxID=749907 RepID=D9PMB2_9ZZZZ
MLKTEVADKLQKLGFDYLAQSPIEELLKIYSTSYKGLFQEDMQKRLEKYGYNEPVKKKRITILTQILTKFLNPLVIVLLIIAGFSLFFGEKISAFLVSLMAIISVALSFFQEYKAGKEAEKLSEMVHTTATVYRNGKPREVNIREIVPGDIVDLFAGDMIQTSMGTMVSLPPQTL